MKFATFAIAVSSISPAFAQLRMENRKLKSTKSTKKGKKGIVKPR